MECMGSEEGLEPLMKGLNGRPRALFIGLGGSYSGSRELQLEKCAKTLSVRSGLTNRVLV